MRPTRRRGVMALLPSAWIATALWAGGAHGDSAEQIEIVCASNWPDDLEERASCRERQTAAASDLIKRIEAAAQTSLEFAIAKACIERAKTRAPATIDWTQALACYKNRLASALSAETP